MGLGRATPTYLLMSKSLADIFMLTFAPFTITFALSRGELLIAMGAEMAVGSVKYVSMAFSFRYEMKG